MSEAIESLITAYEKGALNRRQLVTALAALGLVRAGRAGAGEPRARPGSSVARINHINLRVSDIQRSVDFYTRLFGPGFRQFATMLPFDLGGGSMVPYMSVQTDKDVATEGRKQYVPRWHASLDTKHGTWEHIAFEVDELDVDGTLARLKEAGVEASLSGGFIWTHDPDGALIQIVDAKSAGAKVGQTLEPIAPGDVGKHR
jgi:catechol 2,3-dioxygenase-like lactoylglutathione lyase family enzyme